MSQTNTASKEKKIGILPVPTFGYAPETKFYAGVVSLFTLKHWSDSVTRVSTAKIEASYTQNKQFTSELSFNLFSRKEKFNTEGAVSWRHFPEFWWGMGNTSLNSALTLYDAKRFEIDMRVSRKYRRYCFVGLRYKMMWIYGIDNATITDNGLLNAVGTEGGIYNGIGPTLNIDNRKNILNPRQGYFLRVSALAFPQTATSASRFLKIETELRKYISLRKNKDVLAFHFYSQLNPGSPPFRLTGLLGSDRDMRGYYQGRFRDQYYFSIQSEYRLHLVWRLGLAAFVGAGDVGGQFSQNSFDSIKPSYGLGLRFLTIKEDDVNLRVDVAFGRQTQGIYIAFGEAF